ncbi:MAG: pgm, partial [Chlamydiales bacterium]|nr:pgm [Chlamydiales bacterium]
KKYGIYKERLISLNFPETQQGRAQMQSAMQSLRSKPPKNIGHHRIFVSQDLLSGQSTNHEKKETSPIDLPPSDVLVFLTEEGYKIVIRPSGTEPKVKVYLGVSNLHSLYLEQGMLQCQQKLDELQAEMRALFQS